MTCHTYVINTQSQNAKMAKKCHHCKIMIYIPRLYSMKAVYEKP